MNVRKVTMLIVLTVAAFGCVSIPPEAPQLSVEIGKRIAAIEDSNIVLLNKFFQQKRDEVDRFVQEEWVPEFAEQVFSDPKISRVWNQIVASGNTTDRLEFIVRTGPKLQKKINSKRTELIKPLDDLERAIERRLRDEYRLVMSMNSTVTSFLLSAAKVAESRNQLLEQAGINQEKVDGLIDQTDQTVSRLLDSAEDAQDKVSKGKNFLNEISEITKSLN
jgi:methyl-accepting chemotaxis protein